MLDTIPPSIIKLWIYPINGCTPEEVYPKKNYEIFGSKGNYYLKNNEIVILPGNSGLGIEAFDYMTDTVRKHSFYSQKLYIDTVLWFETIFDEISFDQVGYVNSLIDYAKKISDDVNIYKLFVWPNQDLMFNKKINNNGYVSFRDTFIHKLIIELEDINGNKSRLIFYARFSNDSLNNKAFSLSNKGPNCFWNKENLFKNKFIKVFFPNNSLYSDMNFTINKDVCKKLYAPILSKCYSLGNISVSLKKSFFISFPVSNIVDSLRNKLLIISIDKKGNLTSIGGNIKGKYITASTKYFGTYALSIDTTPPTIEPINITANKNMALEDSIKFRIIDKLSGIKEYTGTIDNNWVLFEYDLKNDMLSYTFDREKFTFNQKNHLLILTVIDKRGNKSTFINNFIK